MPLKVTKSLVSWLVDQGHADADGSYPYYAATAADLLAKGVVDNEEFRRVCTEDLTEYDDSVAGRKAFFRSDSDEDEPTMTKETKSDKLFEGRNGTSSGGGSRIVVKTASSQYTNKSFDAKNKFGVTVESPFGGGLLQTQSDASKALTGVLIKHLASKSGLGIVLTEHERSLLDDLAMQNVWAGEVNGEYKSHIPGGRWIKSLLDDGISGGLNINPVFFDEDVVTFPLLNGELFPFITVQDLPRGRIVTGGSIGTPSMTWGNAEGTAFSLFNTAALVNALSTTVYPVTCAIEIGRDFLSDSPVDVGSHLTGLIGDKMTEELDRVVAAGNGTLEPLGLSRTPGLTTISTTGGAGGPPTLADYLNLMFSVGKQYRNKQNNSVCFVSNDVSYQRSRGIKIDANNPSTDQRSVLDPMMSNQGAFVNAYSTLGWSHRIQNDLPSGTSFFVDLKRFKMFRRLGLTLEFVREGKTLALNNTVLLIARARYGGMLRDVNACSTWTNGQN